LLRSEEA